jgi:hypothetical protein
LSNDIEAVTHREHDDPAVTLSEDALKDCALYEINQVLIRNGHRLEDFPTFPKSITSLLFMEETDWSKKSWLMINIH